ncbi:hypothetical protein [Anthocerotibacter panamensis]|uniref:hypothetical protein n=1 Tax=Anthocerotibacter panamensis TaxID=2857077 RepID=UPI001C4053B9|nr:hypothetical protein [Anthocerotibacter panamensis]
MSLMLYRGVPVTNVKRPQPTLLMDPVTYRGASIAPQTCVRRGVRDLALEYRGVHWHRLVSFCEAT